MSITRWDPFHDMMSLREAMANLLEESYVAPRAGQQSAMGTLAVNVKETPEAFEVTAALPGVKPEDVDISVLGETLRIQAETKEEREQPQDGNSQNGRWIVRERRHGMVQRILTLPAQVKADEAKANFEHGVLHLTLPKAEAAKPRAIKVNTQNAIDSTATQTSGSAPEQTRGVGASEKAKVGAGQPAE
ncbi:MAG: Hsp20/alpha crystallin family protein [Thermomicrobiales bacterium]